MTIRVGFYGAGLISRMHAAFLAASSFENVIAAVHDPDQARAKAFASRHGARSVSEADLLRLVDVVYVTTWTAEHARLVEMAASQGLPVCCEKPLAFDAPAAQRMVDVVEDLGVVNQVGLLLRFAPHFILARDLMRDPAAGRTLAISFRDDQYIPNQGRYASTWRTDASLAGRGALLEHSIHDVDILRWLAGDVAAVSAAMREVHGHPRIDDITVARLEFEDGSMAALTSIWHDILERPSMRHVEIFCERLYVSINGEIGGPLRWQYTGSASQELSAEGVTRVCADSASAPIDDLVPFLGGTLFNPASAFLRAVTTGSPSPLAMREALPAHRIVDAIYRSADSGGLAVAEPELVPGSS
jgi:predicted dehydrogenase